ncbi:hypothetical protein DOG16_18395 [Salmonella enterica]|nr:hypothetical protein [Salmonella enterica]EBF8123362.1 hypothetical protein [Salmonella enterica subsp. enterica serovar Aba]EBJ0776684.1 hypothetical protein [Salmonella enterica]EBY6828003.1 hypothetical protein [Salmonella enterica subsp. enterica serovar Aba]
MTFDENELNDALNKIIMTSLFSGLNEQQRQKFYESAHDMIDRCCYCDADGMPAKVRQQLSEALRERLVDRFAELC